MTGECNLLPYRRRSSSTCVTKAILTVAKATLTKAPVLFLVIVMLVTSGTCSRLVYRCSISNRRARFALAAYAPTPSLLRGTCACPVVKHQKVEFYYSEQSSHPRYTRAVVCSSRKLSNNISGADNGDTDTNNPAPGARQIFLDTIRQSLCQDIIPKVLEYNSELAAPTKDSPLVMVLAVSGGCDSVALLHAMKQLTDGNDNDMNTGNTAYLIPLSSRKRAKKGIDGSSFERIPCEIHVAHFDHQQRGQESDGDLFFVKNLCFEAGFTFHAYCWGDNGGSCDSFSQETARNWRREKMISLLETLTNNQKHGVIVTAHHRDDCDETIVLKLLRGAHITSLSGMDSVNTNARESVGSVFAKPMLKIPKAEIEKFLTMQGLPWREDSSNASDKYLRNRVRNQVLPLLSDLVGGDEILHKRLKSLDEQSRKVKEDLSTRAADYVAESASNSRSGSKLFPIPSEGVFGIVHEQALHSWAESESEGQLILSYEQLKRVCDQISSYPSRKQWSLDVGNKWIMRRNGDILLLEGEEKSDAVGGGESAEYHGISWMLLDGIDVAEPDIIRKQTMHLSLPAGYNEKRLAVEYVGGNTGHRFVPPWRRGRGPMKIKDFLRSQKIPLHEREFTPVIRFVDDRDDTVVAVYVSDGQEGDGKWIVHANFEATKDSGTEIHLLQIAT